jgi:hypothetical protein
MATAARVRIIFPSNVFLPKVLEFGWHFNRFALILASCELQRFFLFLSACVTEPPDAEQRSNCALTFQSVVGMPLTAVTLPDGLNHRIIAPGTAVTRDFSPERVNFDLDAKGRITRVWCG